MFLLSAVTLLSLAFPSPASVAWHKSFSLKGRPEIRVTSSNADVRVYASDRKDIEAVFYTDGTISSDAITDRKVGNLLELDVRIARAGLSQDSTVLELKIPLNCDVDVHSRNGSIMRLDFPMAMVSGGQQSRVRGPINGGGQHLEVHSDKGNIMVRKTSGSI